MTPVKTIELLAPAKNLICGLAAINHGADAVYIGGPKFGAREDAGNSFQDIETLVSSARIFGVKVFVALNTILYDSELDEAANQITRLYELGVDALIIQDLGILEMDLPPIALHASTQLHNYLPEQLKFLEAVHFRRAVLARELSLSQIKDIRSQTTLELEAFVHGALCVSFSGRCYLSHAIGGRSANRGACAQPCRKLYTLYDSENKVITSDQHLLSLKDLNHSHSISDLADAGISSLKIEGRLKDVDYVKNITAFYRQKVDAFLEEKPEFMSSSAGKTTVSFEANPSKSFNRGATDYFLNGRSREITSFSSPKFLGETIGVVTKVDQLFFETDSKVEISNNDGLVFLSTKGESIGIKVNTVANGRIYPDKLNGIYPGAMIHRNYDHRFQEELKGDHTRRRISLKIEIVDTENGFDIQGVDETGTTVLLSFEIPKIPARDVLKSKETIVHQLSKAGDTPFLVIDVKTNSTEKYFFQVSVLNTMRRDLINRITEIRMNKLPERVMNLPNDFPYPEKNIGYEWNISNHLARKFFQRHGVENPQMAFEKQPVHHGKTVMTTKHCLKFQLGYCLSFGGVKPKEFREPFSLNDGKNNLGLEFDCAQCVMKVIY